MFFTDMLNLATKGWGVLADCYVLNALVDLLREYFRTVSCCCIIMLIMSLRRAARNSALSAQRDELGEKGVLLHLSPHKPSTIRASLGGVGVLAWKSCRAPSAMGKRLKIITVTDPVFMALPNLLNAKLWSGPGIFVNSKGTVHTLESYSHRVSR